jgi:HAMP domain-containing protein
MNALNPVSTVTLGAMMLLVLAVATAALMRLARARERARRRVVEQPNSHYTPQLVRDNETRHRWRNMPLDGIHEINRAEVERLLARVEAGGTEALREAERSFLDYIAKLAGAYAARAADVPVEPDRSEAGPVAGGLEDEPA